MMLLANAGTGERPMSNELLDLMTARSGHFRFESGHHGDVWLDLDGLFRRPTALSPFVSELAGRLASHRIEGVCGSLTGGAFLAQLVARELDGEFSYTERIAVTSTTRYRLPSGLRGAVAGKRIAIVDDAINAGSAVRGTYQELVAHGGRPVVIGALLVLGSAAAPCAAEANLPLEYLAHRSSNLWEPAACPLCASGSPLDDV
jgi:orotate phosphoribosyltransferase